MNQIGMATIWKNLEPPPELNDRVPHTSVENLVTANGWRMVAASRRGKAHAHQARFRDDSFALGQINDWHLMVVADGGGSCPLARVGARLATNTALSTMINCIEKSESIAAELVKTSLTEGLKAAWQAISDEAKQRDITMRDMGTTFLSVIHCPFEDGSLIGVVQVGDGLLVAKVAGDKIITLAKPDSGEMAGSTLFLTSLHWENWLDRVSVGTLDAPLKLLAAMTDGVSDDFIPFKKYSPKLFEYLTNITQQEQPEQALLNLLSYEKRGSFDDRTLAMLYHRRLPSQLVRQMYEST